MTPSLSAATNMPETKRDAPRPIQHIHAAVQTNLTNNDCEESRDPDKWQKSQKTETLL